MATFLALRTAPEYVHWAHGPIGWAPRVWGSCCFAGICSASVSSPKNFYFSWGGCCPQTLPL